MELYERRDAAMEAAKKSGEMLLKRHELHIDRKAVNDYVTDMDRASERLIIEHLSRLYPQDGFYGEETGVSQRRDGMWLIDPIDGTTNFIRGIPNYTISIAYMRGGELQLGVVYAPALGEMFTAVLGGGAELNGRPIHVSQTDTMDQTLVSMSFIHRVPEVSRVVLPQLLSLLPQLNDMRRLGSAAFDLCCVASGRVDVFVEPMLHLYDIAAGVLIVREAGGKVSGFYDSEDCLISGHVIASNGIMHDRFYNYLRLNPDGATK